MVYDDRVNVNVEGKFGEVDRDQDVKSFKYYVKIGVQILQGVNGN